MGRAVGANWKKSLKSCFSVEKKMEKELIQKFYKYNPDKKQSEKVEAQLFFSMLGKDRHYISFVGAGGKSSLIEAMAAWGTKQGEKVLVTTTTHIFRPESEKLAQTADDLERIWSAGDWAVIGDAETKQPQKLKMPDPGWMAQAMALADLVLIEADGSKRLPCKVPAAHEPVILPETEVVIAVLGLSALGRTLKECCFRLEEAEKLLEADEDHLLSCEDMAKILASEEGLRKGVGGRKYVAVLNQCDDDKRRATGEQIGEKLRGWGVEDVILSKLRNC